MMKKAIILATILLMLASGSVAAVASASTPSSYSTQVQVPYYVYTNETFNMYINSTYGFSNYSVTIYIAGDNLSGISPSNTYHNFSSSNPDFKVSLTAPKATQTLTLLVKTTASTGSGLKKSTETYTVKVISPIFLHASLSNRQSVAMYNVTVNFYVDNTYVASKTISKLGAYQTVVVNYTWTAPYLTKGSHTLKVAVNNSLVSVDNGGTSVTSHFYYGTPPNFTWIYYIAAAVGVFMIIMVSGAGRRPRVGERRPKWRKK